MSAMVGVLDEAEEDGLKTAKSTEICRRRQQWSDGGENELYRTTRRQREDQSLVVAVDIDRDCRK
jgi:hypothetical protein